MTPDTPENPETADPPVTPDAAPSSGLTLQFSTHSEIGLVRKNNQDSGYATASLLVVADGMGGAAAGDLASAVAIDTIRRVTTPVPTAEMLGTLTQAVEDANERIADLVADDYALEGMGTTVTGALFDGAGLGLVHIGDSRAYLFRDGRLERLTHDHSWVQSLVDDGKISDAEAAVHPHRSLLLKVLNGQPANDPDQTTVPLQSGDRLLFCSDGLCGLVDDPDIAEALAEEDRDASLRRLVDEALAEGGIDNITVIVADVSEGEPTAGEFVLGAAAERDIPDVPPRGLADDGDDPEDTVTTLEPIPGEIEDEPEDEARYDPQPPSKRRWRRPLIGLLILVLIIGAGLGAGYAWTRTQYFVGEAAQRVAIYQGVGDPVPGVSLSRVYEVQEVEVANLPPYFQEKVRTGIPVDGLEGARQTVTELSEAADKCIQKRKPTPKPTPTAKPSPSKPTPTKPKSTKGSTKKPSAKPTGKATAKKPSPTPSPSPSTPAPSDNGSPSQGC